VSNHDQKIINKFINYINLLYKLYINLLYISFNKKECQLLTVYMQLHFIKYKENMQKIHKTSI